MKTNKKRILSIILVVILSAFTLCALVGCGGEATAKKGWKAIQSKYPDQFIKCNYIYCKDIGSLEIGWENNPYDAKVYYTAYEDEEGYQCTYFIYHVKTKQLEEIDFDTYFEIHALTRAMEEPTVYKGTLNAD